jgi:hypothetical protein
MLLSSMLPAPLKPASTLSRTWRRVTIHWQQEKKSTEIATLTPASNTSFSPSSLTEPSDARDRGPDISGAKADLSAGGVGEKSLASVEDDCVSPMMVGMRKSSPENNRHEAAAIRSQRDNRLNSIVA